MIDAACVVYRLSQRSYRHMAEQCENALRPARAGAGFRSTARTPCIGRSGNRAGTFDHIAQSIAAYEGSTEVNFFSSK